MMQAGMIVKVSKGAKMLENSVKMPQMLQSFSSDTSGAIPCVRH